MFLMLKVNELLHNPLTDKLILFGDKVSNHVRLKFLTDEQSRMPFTKYSCVCLKKKR